MRRYWKGSDLQIAINITDKKGNTLPFDSIDELTIYLKTTGDEYVKVSKGSGIEADADGNIYIRLNEHSLDNLPDGLLRYDARLKISAEGWDNGYDTVQSCETYIFVKTPDNYVPKANVQEKAVTYTANGDYVLEPDGSYEGISKADIKVALPMESKSVTYTANGDYVLTPDGSYEGMSRADIKVELPLESKSVTYTANGDYTLEPSEGYEGLQDVAIHIEIDTSEAENDGVMKFLRKQMTGKVELPIEAMDTPYCLRGQTGVTEVVVPEGATAIPSYFFSKCTSLEKITYPITVTAFGGQLYDGIDIDKKMSYPIPIYLQQSEGYSIYYRQGQIFDVPKYFNQIHPYSKGAIEGYNNEVAKRFNFQGNIYNFQYTYPRAEEFDFSHNVQIPTVNSTSLYTGMTKVIVPESLYDKWITTSPWSQYADITEAVPDTNYYIPYRTKSGNDISPATGVKYNRYEVVSYSDKKVWVRGTPWDFYYLFDNQSDVTFVDYAAAGLEVPSFNGLFMRMSGLTECTLPTNKPLNIAGMFYGCSSLVTAPSFDTSMACGDVAQMFWECYSLETIPEYDFSNVTGSTSGIFSDCRALTNVGGFIGLKVSIYLGDSPLTHDSLMNIITKAADVNKNPQTLTFHLGNLAKLTDEEKAVATNKGWTLA